MSANQQPQDFHPRAQTAIFTIDRPDIRGIPRMTLINATTRMTPIPPLLHKHSKRKSEEATISVNRTIWPPLVLQTQKLPPSWTVFNRSRRSSYFTDWGSSKKTRVEDTTMESTPIASHPAQCDTALHGCTDVSEPATATEIHVPLEKQEELDFDWTHVNAFIKWNWSQDSHIRPKHIKSIETGAQPLWYCHRPDFCQYALPLPRPHPPHPQHVFQVCLKQPC